MRGKGECRQCGLPQVVSDDHSVYCAWHPRNRKKKETTVPKKKTAKRSAPDTSDHAWVSNYPPLKEWLDKHEARCMWQLPMQQPNPEGEYEYSYGPSAYVECWLVGKRPVIVVVHARKNGWEIYSALDDNRVVTTFADVEKRVGLTLSTSDPALILAHKIIERTHHETECNTPEDAEALAKLVLNKE